MADVAMVTKDIQANDIGRAVQMYSNHLNARLLTHFVDDLIETLFPHFQIVHFLQ